jgi:hypothetical protein
MVSYWVNSSTVKKLQQEIIKNTANRNSNTAYADPETPYIIDNTVDAVHYDAKG